MYSIALIKKICILLLHFPSNQTEVIIKKKLQWHKKREGLKETSYNM